MAKIKPERAAAKEEITSFAGIGGHASSKGRTAGDCCNFRICGDGSLEKRSGWSVKREFNNPIRAVWQGSTSGESLSFAVSGGTVFRLRGTYCDNVGTLSTTEGEVSFLHYGDAVYLQDGKDLWVWRSGTGKMEKVIPYVPLFGQNWHPSSYGDVKEPINLLTRSLRVHYLNTTAATGFSLPFFAESVDVVRVDGRSVTDFYLTAGGDTVQIPSAASGSVVEVAFTMAYSTDQADQLAACTRGFTDTSEGEETVFLYGAPQGYRVFPSRPVSESMQNYCKVFYPTLDPLYFCEEDLINPGDAQNPVTEICRHYGRLLIFCQRSVHWAEKDGEDGLWRSYPLLTGFGCEGKGCLISYEQDLLILYRHGLYRMHATSGNPESVRLTCLSYDVSEHLSQMSSQACMRLEHAFHEVWIRDTQNKDGVVWVYQIPEEKWYRFDGIPASFFLEWDGVAGFAADRLLCLMRAEDVTDNLDPFTA